MFFVTDQDIDINYFKKLVKADESGGFSSFEGWVRNHNAGAAVDGLSYEIYDTLAISEGKLIIEEAMERYKITKARAIHRKGDLKLGDLAVWVGVSSPHRDAAFKACRYIIDEIKDRLPVWKKEHYTSGQTEWVNCQGCSSSHNKSKLGHKSLFSKQTVLKKLGDTGQNRLLTARVLVVGAGGLGCPALTYLASSGVGHVTIMDGDKVEASNLHRQPLFGWQDLGLYKSEIAKQKLLQQMPHIDVRSINRFFKADDALNFVKEFDLVLDCTDNFKAKFMIHDACILAGIPLVQASIYQFEGQLNVFNADPKEACMRCLYPEALEDGCVGNCSEAGVLGPVAGVLGTMQALESIKLLANPSEYKLSETVLVDMQDDFAVKKIKRLKNTGCPLCSSEAKINSSNFEHIHKGLEELEVSWDDLKYWNSYTMVDIREEYELQDNDPQGMLLMSRGEGIRSLDGAVVVVCQKGIRSLHLVRKLRDEGFQNFYSLRGGVQRVL